MKKYIFYLLPVFFCGISSTLSAQQFKVRQGSVSFSVLTPARVLTGTDTLLKGSIDLTRKTFSFRIHVKGLYFNTPFFPDKSNATGTERLHSYYLESDTYPYADFTGKIKQSNLDLRKDGVYKMKVEGKANIHGVSRKVLLDVDVENRAGALKVYTAHQLKTSDYQIRKPGGLIIDFMEEVDVRLNCFMEREK